MSTFFVNTSSDIVADDGVTSLREAIQSANANEGLDRIFVSPLLSNAIQLQSALPEFTDDVIVDGLGASLDTNGYTAFSTLTDGVSVALRNIEGYGTDTLFNINADDTDVSLYNVNHEVPGSALFNLISIFGEDNDLAVANSEFVTTATVINEDGSGNAITVAKSNFDMTGANYDNYGVRAYGDDISISVLKTTFSGNGVNTGVNVFNEVGFDVAVIKSELVGFGYGVTVYSENGGAGGDQDLSLLGNRFEDNGDATILGAEEIDFQSAHNTYDDNEYGITILDAVDDLAGVSILDTFTDNFTAIQNDAVAGSLDVYFGAFAGNVYQDAGTGETNIGLFGF